MKSKKDISKDIRVNFEKQIRYLDYIEVIKYDDKIIEKFAEGETDVEVCRLKFVYAIYTQLDKFLDEAPLQPTVVLNGYQKSYNDYEKQINYINSDSKRKENFEVSMKLRYAECYKDLMENWYNKSYLLFSQKPEVMTSETEKYLETNKNIVAAVQQDIGATLRFNLLNPLKQHPKCIRTFEEYLKLVDGKYVIENSARTKSVMKYLSGSECN